MSVKLKFTLQLYPNKDEIVDGIQYWDLNKNAESLKTMSAEKGRIIQKMMDAKNGGSATQRPSMQRQRLYECETLEEDQFVNNNR
jgi:hypothetical protein